MSDLNPQISEIQIGVRELKPLKIYPLSIADQFDAEQIINESLSKFFEAGDDSEIGFVSYIIGMVKENVTRILQMVTDYTTEAQVRKLLKDVTSNQIDEIVVKVYQMNFEVFVKKLGGLLGKVPVEQLLRRPSPQSLSDTPDSDSNISIDSDSEKAA